MSSQNRIGLILVLVVVISAAVMLFSRDTRASDQLVAGNVNVTCGPAQRAVVQRAEGARDVSVACIDVAADAAVAGYALRPPAGFAPAGYVATPTPAVAYAPALVAPTPVVSAAPAPVRRAASARPSTEKRLLVIGGTAGAGAGVGALVGGGKGALIGAAIGAGGATLVDQIKHR